MAITPYTTPLQYQYKPLNLMAFAEPLMKMQEKYDLTKASLEEADVKASSLQFAADPEKARALEQVYRTKRDELVANLLETKNYTQAASKLKQLNKLWLEDPERVALETNYKTFLERDKEELARIGVGDGKITKEEYLQWRTDEIRKFTDVGGTNFRNDPDSPGGTTYNVVTGTVGRTANMQKDYDETAYKAASAIKAKKWDSALQAMGIEPTVEDMKYMQQHFEKLSPEEIEGAVEQYMRGLDRFKPWLQEKAAYDFKDYLYANDEGASYNTLAKNLLNKGIATIDRDLEKIAKDKGKDSQEYKEALATKEYFQEQLQNPNTKVIEQLYTQDYMNKKYDAKALGDIFRINNSSIDYTFRDIPAATGSGSDFTLAGTVGRTTPTTKELVATDLEAIRRTTTQALMPSMKDIGNIGGGQMRALGMGAKGTTTRSQIEANPALAVPRYQRILALYEQTKGKGSRAFHNALVGAGLAEGVGYNITATVFKALGEKGTAQQMDTTLGKIEDDYGKFQDADNQLRASAKIVQEDKDFINVVKSIEDQQATVSYDTIKRLATAWKTTPEKLISSGVVQYTEPRGSAAGVQTKPTYYLSGKNIAKAYGYNNVQDAVNNGFDFSWAGAGIMAGKINAARDAALQRSYSGNEMGVRLIGDKAVDAALKDEVFNASEMTRYSPLNFKSWANVPGFDEEGNMLGGTKIDTSVSPKIEMRGNTVYLGLSYLYKDEDGNVKSNTIELKAKPGQGALIEEVLRREAKMNYQLKDDNKVAAQTYDDVMVGLYNISHDSKVTPQSASAAHVSASSRKAVLETIKTGEQGTTIQLVKEYVNENVAPVYRAYIVSPNNKKDTGFKATSINGLKVLVAEQLDLR